MYNKNGGPSTNANLSAGNETNTRSAERGVYGRLRMPATPDATASDLGSGDAAYRGPGEKDCSKRPISCKILVKDSNGIDPVTYDSLSEKF